jgi:hypothetical protein
MRDHEARVDFALADAFEQRLQALLNVTLAGPDR